MPSTSRTTAAQRPHSNAWRATSAAERERVQISRSAGHLNQAIYLQYAEHARWEMLHAAGIVNDTLLTAGVGPVTLETTIRYLRELRGGDDVDVSCAFDWGGGKTFTLRQDFHRADGTAVAELAGVVGLLDLTTRRLVPDPAQRFRSLAAVQEVLGL